MKIKSVSQDCHWSFTVFSVQSMRKPDRVLKLCTADLIYPKHINTSEMLSSHVAVYIHGVHCTENQLDQPCF